ncbi:MAG: diaminopimelate epimerase [Candidatus Nitrohelix vancouverensis]|uniref:Diaminopimelate epimerase n=1 Tax=Candidatus Nitrohelix vancouverensis TaxID=2705534 RepID=A0A7T0C0D7_9BACT|nr:MAG: diaminopimelate epimerase [Candidatus Nitrohelix vancouverensis]
MTIQFTKMSGSGNDFVIIDHRKPFIPDDQKRDFVKRVCARRTSVGADGLIFIEPSSNADFRWDFYNDDGSSAEMCGNGGRCAARYAVENKIAGSQLSFETVAGVITADVDGSTVKIKLTKPVDHRPDQSVEVNGETFVIDSLNTGVPHAIIYTNDIENIDVAGIGRGVRFHSQFAPAGTNVDFVQVNDDGSLVVRTYERGVEGETLACGTGVVASALLAARKHELTSPISARTRGGETLKVYFQPGNGSFGDVFLEGLASKSFDGVLGEY